MSEAMQQVRQGKIKILMVSVERLKNERFRDFIKSIAISLMVIDEAHCISEWGHNFRPEYIKLPKYQKEFKVPQVLLLTATATSHVINDMSKAFSILPYRVFNTGFYRQNLNLSVIPCLESEKVKYLINYIHANKEQSTIVYVTLQKTAENISHNLNRENINSEAYHAGLKSEEREKIQERFMQSQTNCIVATIAFGMGIDKQNIRHIVHFDMPKSIENYAQEIGRAGRDGLESNCVLIANYNGTNLLKSFIYGNTPEAHGIQTILDELKRSTVGKTWEVNLNQLTLLSDIRMTTLKIMLVYLEIQNIIQAKYSYYAEYKYKILITEDELINKFEGERKAFISSIIKHSKKAIKWFTVNLEAIQDNYQTTRERIITALDYLHEKGWISLESKKMTEVYDVLNINFDINNTVHNLYQQFKHREQAQIQRIEDMLDIFQDETCISLQLSQYFGDIQVPQACGHCSVCLENYNKWYPKESLQSISFEEIKEATESLDNVIKETFSQPASIELKSCYLTGITSPWLTKVKARNLGGFAKYENYGYAYIHSLIESSEQPKVDS